VKSTYTDSIIPNDSCYPTEHKYAAVRYLQNRMNCYQLSREKRDKESKITQDILQNNGYNTSTLKSISNKKQERRTEKTYWSKFTYIGKETRTITKVLKNTTVKVTYSTNNTLGNLLTKKQYPSRGKYENSGIYQLTCLTCNMKYTGQTRRSFRTCFQEYLRDQVQKWEIKFCLKPARKQAWHWTYGGHYEYHTHHWQRKANGPTRKILHIPRDETKQPD